MALLAATTLGADIAAETVRAEVTLSPSTLLGQATAYRLIVQSFDAAAKAADLRAGRAKPVGSMQRVVSAEELKNGVRVDLVELHEAGVDSDSSDALVVAWLERVQGQGGDYDVDARDARMPEGSVCGFGRRDADEVKIRLRA